MTLAPSFSVVPKQFSFIPEFDEEFLTLFPHRGSYLWAEHPALGQRPEWNTETKHLLSDRLILQGAYLYGVRFGKDTNYLMLDIDRKSAYHPDHDPYAISRVVEALEPLGLYRYVAVSSSYSGGLHLYFPFLMGQRSWALAQAAALLLEHHGFKLDRGQLELFPNPRRSDTCDYNGHRLPLQLGSYLLNSDWEPCFTTRDRFCEQWRFAQNHNPLTDSTLHQILKQHQRRAYRRFGKTAQKFLNDLNAEIEPGWTGHGQTNFIIGKIALREYVFFHALYGGTPLQGIQLANRIADVAETLPGYQQWCRHKRDLASRCLEWARAIEASEYYPYGGTEVEPLTSTPIDQPTWNQQQSENARQRIKDAVEHLIRSGDWPSTVRGRIFALKKCKVASDTLYRNKDLWHPENDPKPLQTGVIHPVEAKQDDPKTPEPLQTGVIHPVGPISFITASEGLPKTAPQIRIDDPAVGGAGGGFHSPPTTETDPPLTPSPHHSPTPGPHLIKQLVDRLKVEKLLQRAAPPPPTAAPPPDEAWFQQMHLTWGGGT